MTTSIRIRKEIYEVYDLTGDKSRMVYASGSLDDAVQKAKFWLRYEPTIDQVNQLKAFFKRSPFETSYVYTVNSRTVSVKKVRT